MKRKLAVFIVLVLGFWTIHADALPKKGVVKETPVPPQIYTITWKIGAEIETTTAVYGEKPIHADPVKTSDVQYTYTFVEWYPEVKETTEDTIYEAVFRNQKKAYTITWQDASGKIIDTTSVKYGEEPTHEDVTKASDQQYVYTFNGWEPEIQTVTGEATYRASFISKLRSYTITWQDENGKTLDTTSVKYGEKPTHADVEKASDQEYEYTFKGWEPEIRTVTGDATYRASFIYEPIETWVCSNCLAKNIFDDIICTNCGQTRLCDECGVCIPVDDNYCWNCGNEIKK